MEFFITILIGIICFFLVIVVLAQNSKGGGLAAGMGGSGSAQLMGVKKTGDLLEKLTWGFAIALIVLTLSVNLIYKNSVGEGPNVNSVNVQRAQEEGGGGKLVPQQETEKEEPAPAQAPKESPVPTTVPQP